MSREAQHTYCTDAQWVGRSDCRNCNVRNMMLFSSLPDVAFDKVLSPIDNLRYGGGAVLYDEGQPGEVIFTIRRGLVKLLHLSADGSQRILRLLGGGSAVGLELLDGSPIYRHSAVAVNHIDVCRIPVSTIAALEKDFPELAGQERHRLQQHLDQADEWILTMGTGPARQRVAHLLLFLHRYSADANGDIELLPGEDMAAIVGTAVETVSRVIADFKRRRLLHRVAVHLYRCDTAALETVTRDAAV
ncbi:MAG: Crp/Fnr family transcriptional regulator [Gammaproteobacteria bacterium]